MFISFILRLSCTIVNILHRETKVTDSMSFYVIRVSFLITVQINLFFAIFDILFQKLIDQYGLRHQGLIYKP